MSLVTPAELMREGAMLSEFAAHFPDDFVSGTWHAVAIYSPEGEHLSTAEFIVNTEESTTSAFLALHFARDGSEPSPECVACLDALEAHLASPKQIARLEKQLKWLEQPDQAMMLLLAQFKLKSAALGGGVLSVVIALRSGVNEHRNRTFVTRACSH